MDPATVPSTWTTMRHSATVQSLLCTHSCLCTLCRSALDQDSAIERLSKAVKCGVNNPGLGRALRCRLSAGRNSAERPSPALGAWAKLHIAIWPGAQEIRLRAGGSGGIPEGGAAPGPLRLQGTSLYGPRKGGLGTWQAAQQSSAVARPPGVAKMPPPSPKSLSSKQPKEPLSAHPHHFREFAK